MNIRQTSKKITVMADEKRYKILYYACVLTAVSVGIFMATEVQAAAFDLDKGIKAMFVPMEKAIDDHYGKALLASTAGNALLGQGDLRERGVRAGIGACVGGGVMLLAKGFFS
jgi:hypothetical protein